MKWGLTFDTRGQPQSMRLTRRPQSNAVAFVSRLGGLRFFDGFHDTFIDSFSNCSSKFFQDSFRIFVGLIVDL